MSKDFKIIFVHGWDASSNEHWYPNISKELTKLRIDFAIPNLPKGDHPKALEWLDALRNEVIKTTKPIVFVGHSLGTRTILLYLEKYKIKVKEVFLISTFANRLENSNKYDEGAYADFFKHKIDIDNIKKYANKFIVIHSKDDPLDYGQGVEISKDLDAKLISLDGKGHMSGPKNALIILNILRKELEF